MKWSKGCPISLQKRLQAFCCQSGNTVSLMKSERSLRLSLSKAESSISWTWNRLDFMKMNYALGFTSSSLVIKTRLSNLQASWDFCQPTGFTEGNKCLLSSFVIPRWRARSATVWSNSSGGTFHRIRSFLLCWWVERMKKRPIIKIRFRRSRQIFSRRSQMAGPITVFTLTCSKRSTKWLLAARLSTVTRTTAALRELSKSKSKLQT